MSTPQTRMYQYETLPGQRFIRLVSFSRSASWNSPIECLLETYELHEGKYPDYTTLSYTWGQGSRDVPISVGGGRLLITPSLEEALRQIQEFRERGEKIFATHWWIDMICINQDDLVERGQQVSLMRDIFTLSIETLAWLGPASQDSDQAMSSLAKRDCDHVGYGSPLSRLLSRPYWKRVWVVQEICVSDSVLLACGNKLVEWTTEFESNLDVLHGEPRAVDISTPFTIPVHKLLENRRISRGQSPGPSSRQLARFIGTSDEYDASDPRDRIYSLLGLAVDGHAPKITPDYSRSGCAVHCEAFRVMCRDLPADCPSHGAIKNAAESSRHRPLDEDDSLRHDCDGLHCGSAALCSALAGLATVLRESSISSTNASGAAGSRYSAAQRMISERMMLYAARGSIPE